MQTLSLGGMPPKRTLASWYSFPICATNPTPRYADLASSSLKLTQAARQNQVVLQRRQVMTRWGAVIVTRDTRERNQSARQGANRGETLTKVFRPPMSFHLSPVCWELLAFLKTLWQYSWTCITCHCMPHTYRDMRNIPSKSMQNGRGMTRRKGRRTGLRTVRRRKSAGGEGGDQQGCLNAA